MVKGVIHLDSQLGINMLPEPEVLCRGDISVVNPGSVECGSVPSGQATAQFEWLASDRPLVNHQLTNS